MARAVRALTEGEMDLAAEAFGNALRPDTVRLIVEIDGFAHHSATPCADPPSVGAGVTAAASSKTADACVMVTSLSTPSAPMMKPANRIPLVEMPF